MIAILIILSVVAISAAVFLSGVAGMTLEQGVRINHARIWTGIAWLVGIVALLLAYWAGSM